MPAVVPTRCSGTNGAQQRQAALNSGAVWRTTAPGGGPHWLPPLRMAPASAYNPIPGHSRNEAAMRPASRRYTQHKHKHEHTPHHGTPWYSVRVCGLRKRPAPDVARPPLTPSTLGVSGAPTPQSTSSHRFPPPQRSLRELQAPRRRKQDRTPKPNRPTTPTLDGG